MAIDVLWFVQLCPGMEVAAEMDQLPVSAVVQRPGQAYRKAMRSRVSSVMRRKELRVRRSGGGGSGS